jgi:hypothetical protein
MEENKKEPRISSTQGVLLVGTAIIFDLISLIPAIGQILAIVGAAVVFSIWFLILHIPLVSPKKLLGWATAGLVEAIPIISWIPSITGGVILMIAITRAEDKLGLQVLSTKGLANPTQIVGQLKGKVLPFQPRQETGETTSAQRPHMNDMRTSNTSPQFPREAANDNRPRQDKNIA